MSPNTVRMEYRGVGHYDEFIGVLDSLGRWWNPLLHPRDRLGRFIRTFSFVSFNMPGTAPGTPDGYAGRVSGVDPDGNVRVKLTAVPANSQGPKVGDYVDISHADVEVKTIKARLPTRNTRNNQGGAGRLNGQESRSLRKSLKALQGNNMQDAARKLQQAIELAEANVNTTDPAQRAAAQESKQRAIDLLREVADAVDQERGKGFKEGDDFEKVKATLDPSERRRLQELDSITANTYTARHSLGDRTLDLENDEGAIKAKATQVRNSAIANELRKDEAAGAVVWDATGTALTSKPLANVVKAEVRDEVRTDTAPANALPALKDTAFYQRARSGLNRLAGWHQAKQVAPADRFHVDKDGNEVYVGSIVQVDKGSARRAYAGIVTRVYTDAQGNKKVYVRDFDPDLSQGYTNREGKNVGYHDWPVTSQSIQLAPDDNQNEVFQQLAVEGVSAKSLVNAFTDEYLKEVSRRLASPGAKRISPTSPTQFDLVPIQDRVRMDANGEMVKIGDHVAGPNGEIGVVTYIQPNNNNVKIEYPNGQKADRVASWKTTRMHGATSDVFLQDANGQHNSYVPTRAEAATIAGLLGADDVADAINNDGDDVAIKQAMVNDDAFQSALAGADELFQRRDQALASGNELSPQDREDLQKWESLAAASAGVFRDDSMTTHTLPAPPTPVPGKDAPQDPSNPGRTISPDGASSDGTAPAPTTPAPSGPTPQPAPSAQPSDDEEATPAPAPQPGGASLADKILSDVDALVKRAKQAPGSNVTQKQMLDQFVERLNEAVTEQDADAFVRHLKKYNGQINATTINKNLRGTDLGKLLGGRTPKTQGQTMHDFVQAKIDAGTDIFNGAPAATQARPPSSDETPEGISPTVDAADADLAEALLNDDGSTVLYQGNEPITDGYYVLDADSVEDLDAAPTADQIAEFFGTSNTSLDSGVVIWQDDNGQFHMGLASLTQDEDAAKQIAENNGSNQYVDIASGQVYNIATGGGDDEITPESEEDARSTSRGVRKSGAGAATTRTTSKQKSVLDKLAELPGAPTDVINKIKSGEEIEGADASQLADFVNSTDVGEFDKSSDKGVAQQLADRIARATGETGARPYSSPNTALRRSSDVNTSLNAQSQDDEIRTLTEDARNAVKAGDLAGAADKYREAADIFESLGLPDNAAADRAREHADRLDAASATGAPESPTGTEAPGAPESETPAPEQAPAAPTVDPTQMRAYLSGTRETAGDEWVRDTQVPQGETLLVGGIDTDVIGHYDISEAGKAALDDAGISSKSYSELDRDAATVQGMDVVSGRGDPELDPVGPSTLYTVEDMMEKPKNFRYIVSEDGTSGIAFTDLPNGGSGEIGRIFGPDEASIHASLLVGIQSGANRVLLSDDDSAMFDIFGAHGFIPVAALDAGTDMGDGHTLGKKHYWFVRDPSAPADTIDVANVPSTPTSQAGVAQRDVASRYARLSAQMSEISEIVSRDPASLSAEMAQLDDLKDSLAQYGVTNFGNNKLEDLYNKIRTKAPITQQQRDEAERLRETVDSFEADSSYAKRMTAALQSYDTAVQAKNWQGAREAIGRMQFVENNPDGVGGLKADRLSEVDDALKQSMVAASQQIDKAARGRHVLNAAWNDYLDFNDKPQVVDTDALNLLAGQGWVQIYRTVNTAGGITAKDMIDNIRFADNYFIGTGGYGQGLYHSDALSGSLAYSHFGASAAQNPNDSRVEYVRVAISPDARWIDHTRLYSLINAHPELYGLDEGIAAAILGYDVITIGKFGSGTDTYYNVINRGVLAIEDVNHGQPISIEEAQALWEAAQQAQNTTTPTPDAPEVPADGEPAAPAGGAPAAPAGGGPAAP